MRLWHLAPGRQLVELAAAGPLGLATVLGGWFRLSPAEHVPNPDLLCLHLATAQGPGGTAWQVLPFAGLEHWLNSPEKVRRALAGDPVAPADLS